MPRKTSATPAEQKQMKQNTASPKRKSTPQHIRRLQTETAILASAETLFVKRGYHRTTIDQIASAAGLTKGAVYVHFKDKQALLMVLLERAEQQVVIPILERLDASDDNAIDKLVTYVHSWSQVAIHLRNTMFLPILMSFEFLGSKDPIEEKIITIYERSYKTLGRVISEGQSAGLILSNDNPREYAAVLIAYMEGLLLEWLRRGHALDGESITRVARRMMISGLFDTGAKTGTETKGQRRKAVR